jgi:hypothetical protein
MCAGCGSFRVLLHEDAEDIGEMFVQRARLILVDQRGGVLRDAVRQFVADDVERFGEAVEQLSVAVAVDHLLPVPQRVRVVHAVVNRGVERETASVDGAASVNLRVEIVRDPCAVVGLAGSYIRDRLRAFAAQQLSR